MNTLCFLRPGLELHTVSILCIRTNLNEPLSRFGRTYGNSAEGGIMLFERRSRQLSCCVSVTQCEREGKKCKRVPGA